MFRSWGVYSVSLISSFVFFLCYKMWVSWILLIIVLAVPLLSLVMSLAASATMKFKADCPAAIRLGDEIHLNVTTSGIASYFSFCKVRMTVTDYMAGKTVKKVFMIHDRGTSKIPVDTSHCGAYSYRLTWLYIYDLFGLFFVKINLNMNNEILVKPVPAMPSVMPDMFGFKAKNLRRSKLPNSEIYDIREYQIGDPLRSIHWKMSAKKDALLVKEPLEEYGGHSRVLLRMSGDRDEMLACARRELETAKRHLALVRADSRIGYECSNHYFYLPHDLIEKILCCRDVFDRLDASQTTKKEEKTK